MSSLRDSQQTAVPRYLLVAKSANDNSSKTPEQKYIVSTSETAARQVELTGGKGGSLAVLTGLAQLNVAKDTKVCSHVCNSFVGGPKRQHITFKLTAGEQIRPTNINYYKPFYFILTFLYYICQRRVAQTYIVIYQYPVKY